MRADARLKRAQIITAAMELYRTVPASQVTMEGIAAEADVGIATVYRHFPRRSDLRQACALGLIEFLDDFLAETLEHFDTDPQGKWESFVWRLADFGVGMLVGALVTDLPSVAPEVLEQRDRFFADVEVLLAKAAEHGLIDPGVQPIELASELIVVTRPMDAQLTALFPDVRERLVRHLLVSWRVRE
ncbi:TetR/AcrR family transcriptional regulator [Corynebacterium sp. TA-R-1]|uniref:TetR/AcrR family transcriptional regulator n=1 Tax=Corynebacterium stercoris TaxID=2943490 RepID=A0ABT1G4U9_9CORY|nr:TetR/AcrR family transcriptional regulator [Corynebacterium stercoris]MCP1388093.1 TetR/AcrR family transcriptional regulator [Corynebacterium stercoris]